MILPEKMLRVRMVVFHRDENRLLERLRGKGIFHFSDFSDSHENWAFKGMPNVEDYSDLLSLYDKINELDKILESEVKKGFLEEMFPEVKEAKISEYTTEEINNRFSTIKSEIDELKDEEERLERIRKEILSHRKAIEVLKGFKGEIENFKLPKQTRAFFGHISIDEFLPLSTVLERNEIDGYLCYKEIRKGGKRGVVLLVLVDEKKGELLGRILEKHEFHNIPLPSKEKDVVEVLKKIGDALSKLERDEKKAKEELKRHANEHVKTIRSYLAKVKKEIDLAKVRDMFGKTERTFLVEGWIKEKDKKRFEQVIAGLPNRPEVFYYKPDEKKSSIPVALDNPAFVRPFEMLTRMFSPPHYGEIDPTPFLAMAFTLFFGIMFADIFDALLLLVIATFFYFRFRYVKNTKSVGQILIICALSALFFGFLGGEFAGFEVFAKHEILQPTNLLLFALGLGVTQIVLGYAVGAANALRTNDIHEFLGGKLGWLLVIAGIALGYFVYWQFAGISALGILLVFVFKGLREVLDITRLLSNFFSYVRLLALNMAHVGLSATFASISGALFSLGMAGMASGALFILFAHVFIVVISLFAVFAHALRLQYVEFFSKFYEGGGTTFNPF